MAIEAAILLSGIITLYDTETYEGNIGPGLSLPALPFIHFKVKLIFAC